MATKHINPLAAARITGVRAWIAHFGSLALNADNYKMLRYEGFTRRDVDHAIEVMLAAGEITIDLTHGSVVVRIAKQAARQGGE